MTNEKKKICYYLIITPGGVIIGEPVTFLFE